MKHIIALRPIAALIVFAVLLTACGGAASTPSPADVETAVAGTLQAAQSPATPTVTGTPEPPAAATNTLEPTNTLLPTASPVPVLQVGSFIPYTAGECEVVRGLFEDAIGGTVTVETAAFTDRVTGGTGTACRVLAEGNGAAYGMAGPYNTLVTLLQDTSWSEDIQYGAGGPMGMSDGFRRNNALGLLSVMWQPSADANCPNDQPIGACNLTAEQKLFTVNFDIARLVVYVPLSAGDCANSQALLQPVIPVTLVQETVEILALDGLAGTACQVHAVGTGLDFDLETFYPQLINDVLVANGWTLVNGADGASHTTREYANGNLIALLSYGMDPSADANCPNDQPISACVLEPVQRIYDLTVAFAQR